MLQPLVATEEDFVEVSVTEAVKVAAEDAAVVKRIRLASLFIFKDLLTSCLALVAPGAGEDLQLLHADPAADGCPGRRGGGDGGPGQRDEAAAEPPGVQ